MLAMEPVTMAMVVVALDVQWDVACHTTKRDFSKLSMCAENV